MASKKKKAASGSLSPKNPSSCRLLQRKATQIFSSQRKVIQILSSSGRVSGGRAAEKAVVGRLWSGRTSQGDARTGSVDKRDSDGLGQSSSPFIVFSSGGGRLVSDEGATLSMTGIVSSSSDSSNIVLTNC
ncbi:CID11 [Iris pallida]|uniref:CID11 n=1 Tax=Iris pallida TaxID=29817 RepID=A0AAX6FD89_IRIPA|nr:CID11 [Iris pallida]KAJ6813905.1 CID11 [Iris pallida]